MKTAALQAPRKKPAHWDKRVAAAYLRIQGNTQEQAAGAVGRNPRTLREWEKHPTWIDARDEARERWMADAEDVARTTVLRSMRLGNADLAMRFLERVDKRLEPKQKMEHSGSIQTPGLTVVVKRADAGAP